MNYIQILSTKVGSNGWMDMNLLTPYGLLSIEFRIDDESIQALSILDFIHFDQNMGPENRGQPDDKFLGSLMNLAEILTGKDRCDQVEPFEWGYKNNFIDKSFRIIAN